MSKYVEMTRLILPILLYRFISGTYVLLFYKTSVVYRDKMPTLIIVDRVTIPKGR